MNKNSTHPVIEIVFENENFSGKKLNSKEYDGCTFINCDFTEADLSVVTFLECRFENCNFSQVKLKQSSFQEVYFKECKMLGLNFSSCNDFMFSVVFDHCILEYTNFYGFSMKHTRCIHCSLKEADFTEADLSSSIFDECNLLGAIFNNTIIAKADFRTAYNYSIDPEANIVKKAKFRSTGLLGLLDTYDLDIE